MIYLRIIKQSEWPHPNSDPKAIWFMQIINLGVYLGSPCITVSMQATAIHQVKGQNAKYSWVLWWCKLHKPILVGILPAQCGCANYTSTVLLICETLAFLSTVIMIVQQTTVCPYGFQMAAEIHCESNVDCEIHGKWSLSYEQTKQTNEWNRQCSLFFLFHLCISIHDIFPWHHILQNPVKSAEAVISQLKHTFGFIS